MVTTAEGIRLFMQGTQMLGQGMKVMGQQGRFKDIAAGIEEEDEAMFKGGQSGKDLAKGLAREGQLVQASQMRTPLDINKQIVNLAQLTADPNISADKRAHYQRVAKDMVMFYSQAETLKNAWKLTKGKAGAKPVPKLVDSSGEEVQLDYRNPDHLQLLGNKYGWDSKIVKSFGKLQNEYVDNQRIQQKELEKAKTEAEQNRIKNKFNEDKLKLDKQKAKWDQDKYKMLEDKKQKRYDEKVDNPLYSKSVSAGNYQTYLNGIDVEEYADDPIQQQKLLDNVESQKGKVPYEVRSNVYKTLDTALKTEDVNINVDPLSEIKVLGYEYPSQESLNMPFNPAFEQTLKQTKPTDRMVAPGAKTVTKPMGATGKARSKKTGKVFWVDDNMNKLGEVK